MPRKVNNDVVLVPSLDGVMVFAACVVYLISTGLSKLPLNQKPMLTMTPYNTISPKYTIIFLAELLEELRGKLFVFLGDLLDDTVVWVSLYELDNLDAVIQNVA